MSSNAIDMDLTQSTRMEGLVSALREIEEGVLDVALSSNVGTSAIVNKDGLLLHQDREIVSKVLGEVCDYLQEIGLLERYKLREAYIELLNRIAFLRTEELLSDGINAQNFREKLIANLPFTDILASSFNHILKQLITTLNLIRDIVIKELKELAVFKNANVNPDLSVSIIADVAMKAQLIVELGLLDYTHEQ
jgi:hypothetical protein